MPIRRYSDPEWVQQIWDAVKFIQHQRQQTDITRITRYLQRIWDHPPVQSEYHIKQLLQDNLLVSSNRTVQKGNKVGSVTESYKVPLADNSTPENDGHDWYCIECHLSGDVICCSLCHRVFHLKCYNEKNTKESLNKSQETGLIKTEETIENNDTKFVAKVTNEQDVSSSAEEILPTVCSVCCLLQNENEQKMTKEELNYLLNFTFNRIKIWLPAKIIDTMAPRTPQPWINEQELRWRTNKLLYQTMDLEIIEMKLNSKQYSKLAEFHADVITIQHNVAVFHGLDSQEMESSKLMLQDCAYDLVELAQCVDCYRHSNEKCHSNWFCIPCKPAHELVWAKLKGYSYWPAKVIKITNGQYDVRFFGAKHLRSIVDTSCIKPIGVHIQSLQIKRTQAFNKALCELQLHQNLLANPEEVPKLILQKETIFSQQNETQPSSISKKKILKKQKISSDIDCGSHEIHNVDFNCESQKKKDVLKKKKTKIAKILRKSKRSMNISNDSQTSSTKEYDVIDLSDGECKSITNSFESRHDFVSSSTGPICSQPTLSVEKMSRSRNRRGSSGATQQLDRPYSDPVEKLRRMLESFTNKEEMIRVALDTMQHEIDRLQNTQAEHLRTIVDAHNVHISETKKKQWCYNCEREAIYHCCWNTAYCSTTCQQQHWQSEHKKVCRRKR